MEVKLNVTIELGEKTLGLISALSGASAPATKAEPKTAKLAPVKDEQEAEAPKEEKAAPAPKAPAASTGKATPAPKAATTAKPAAPAPKAKADDFGDLDAEGQLEAIKAQVTKHTKKGKSADIKALLSNFGVAKASELEEGDYADFHAAISRYTAGETVEDIFPSLD